MRARTRTSPERTKAKHVGKPRTRAAQLKWAETLGMDELGWIHGGNEQVAGCCPWNTYTRGDPRCRCLQDYKGKKAGEECHPLAPQENKPKGPFVS